MKRLSLVSVGLLFGMNAMAQTNADPIIMRINNIPVTRSEFEYSYNKNNSDGVLDKKGVKDYVPLFIDFKLKVEAAKDAGIDTLSSIRTELYGYREQMVIPTVVDSGYIEREARKTYDDTAARFGGEDLLNASHILVLLRQDADESEEVKAKARIDSIYKVLKDGADFADVAKACSDDKGSAARGGLLGQFGKGMMIPDFEKAAYAMQSGEMSAPVKTTVGWHIIKMNDRHPFEPYEYHRSNIIKFLEQRGVRDMAANAYIDSLARQGGVERQAVVDSLFGALVARDAESKNLAQEYYDGTLMYEICKAQIWDKAAKDSDGMAAYFKANRAKYAWTEPRYRGIVIHAKDAAAVKRAKKVIKGVNEDEWSKTIVEALNNDSVKLVRVERGLYKKGENKAIDKFVFKAATAYEGMKDYPATAVCGKKLKQPQTYMDVRGQVATDYQTEQEKRWVETLRQKYTYSVDDSVLETVNNH